MKNLLIFISLGIFVSTGVNASEIIGQISTNPNASLYDLEDSLDEQPDDPAPVSEEVNNNSPVGGSSAIFNNKETKQIKVLGISYYPDESLLRGSDHKIYYIQDQTKKYIPSLEELQKYSGQIIHDVDDEELNKYQERQYLNNDLIREKGTAEIYVIKNGQRKHILSLEELRDNYYGQEIFNISSDEMVLYL